MPSSTAAVVVFALFAGLMPTLGDAETTGLGVIDRIVAVVDEDPILHSEIERSGAFGDDPTASERQILDGLIEQRLRLHEVERHDLAPIADSAVEAQMVLITERFGGTDALDRQLARAGLDRAALRQRIRHQLRVLAFVDERLSARVFVSEDAVIDHYETTFTDELVERGVAVPPLDEVRGSIRRLIEERALADEVELWTEDLRRRARIVDLLDQAPPIDPLPPLVERIDEAQPPSRR